MLEHSRSLSTLLGSSKEDLSQQQEAISTQMREAKKQAFIAHQRYEKMIQECSDVRNVLSQCTQELASSQSQESEALHQEVGLEGSSHGRRKQAPFRARLRAYKQSGII